MRKFRSLLICLAVAIPLWALASTTVTVNGSNHTIPQTNERGWGNAVTAWIQAISTYTLQPTGGTFTLTNDVDFGGSYGLKTGYLSTRTANPSTSGLLRLAKTDSIGWRNNANGGNLLLTIDASDNLNFNGDVLTTKGAGVFADSGFYVYDLSDSTKKVELNPGGTTGTKSTLTFSQTSDRVLTFPDASTTLVGTDTTQTLTNKTLTSPAITTPTGLAKSDVGLSNVDNTSDSTKNSASVTLTNKTINGSNNSITNIDLTTAVTGTLPITSGGTGQTTASAAFDALAPSQTANSGKYLTTNGTTASWASVDALPSQGGNSGKLLTTNGSAASWTTATDIGLPSQTSNSGKFLTTNGTTTSWGTAALTAQGQNEGSGVTTTTLKTAYDQFTTTASNERLIETGYQNLLLNPGFEATTATTSWTQGSGTSCAAETTEVVDGKKSLLCTLTAATAASVYQDVTPTVKMSGINFEYGVWIKTASTTLSVCARQAAATVGSCTTVQGDSVWHFYPINYPGPSSGSVGVAVVPLSSTTGTYYIDTGYVGKARNIGTVAQASFFGGMEQAGAGSCAYSENTSTGNTDFKDLGSSSGCSAWTVTGGVTATGTNDHRPVLSNLAPGTYKVDVTGTVYTDTSAQSCIFRLSDGTNTYQPQGLSAPSAANGITVPSLSFSIPYTTAQSSVTLKLQASDNGAGSCSLYNASGWSVSWKIYYFPSQAQTVVRMDQASWRVDANISGANPSLGTSAVTSYTGIENGSLTLTNNTGINTITAQIPCSSTNSPSGTTCSSGNESVGVSFNLPKADDVLACASFGWAGAVGAGLLETTFQIVETPSNAQTISQEGKGRVQAAVNTASSGHNYPFRVCGTFSFSSSGQKTLRLMYEQQVSGTVTTSVLLGDASSTAGQRDVHWEVYPLSVTAQAPLLVGGVTSNSSGMERVERALISCSSSSSITSQSGTWISSIGNVSGGACTITLASGIFSAAPICTATASNASPGSNVTVAYLNVASSTSIVLHGRYMSSGSSTINNITNDPFYLICQGPR